MTSIPTPVHPSTGGTARSNPVFHLIVHALLDIGDALVDAAKVLLALDLHPAGGAGLLHALAVGAGGRIQRRGGLAMRRRGDRRGMTRARPRLLARQPAAGAGPQPPGARPGPRPQRTH